jgi:hypothetical protein
MNRIFYLLIAVILALGCATASAEDSCATEKEIIAMSADEYWYSSGLTASACDRKFNLGLKASLMAKISNVKKDDDMVANGGLQSYAKKLEITVEQLQAKLEHSVDVMRGSIFPSTFPSEEECTVMSKQLDWARLKAGVDEATRVDVKFAHQQGHICSP